MWKLSPLSRDCQDGERAFRPRGSQPRKNVDDKVKREKLEYDESLEKFQPALSVVDLDMTVKFVDGDEVIGGLVREV
jgi:hypothetical protein